MSEVICTFVHSINHKDALMRLRHITLLVLAVLANATARGQSTAGSSIVSRVALSDDGSLVADRSRGIAYIAYDDHGNPQTIYFTNGNETRYAYGASGQKLRVAHYVAKPNITRTFGVKPGGSTQDEVLFTGQTNYYPFGAPYADPNAVMGATVQPYKYNGKELDRMHGLDTYDYGARQYDPILARWDRVDPLCENYYGVSLYAYCGDDPVNKVDPNGLDEWEINSKGFLVNRIEKKEYDGFFIVSDAGKRTAEKSLILPYGTVVNYFNRENSKKEEYDVFELTGNSQTKQLFTFLADNTSVEWNLATGGWIASGAYLDYLTTSHNDDKELGIVSLIDDQLSKGYYLLNLYHNHPDNSSFPSGLGYKIFGDFEPGDKQHAQWVSQLFGDKVRFSIYVSNKKQFVSYGPNSSLADFPEFWDFHIKK